jgi:acyl-coenzyme A thioesterase PaaI-like protein
MGALLDRVAVLCAERELGRPARTLDLHYSYLAPATDGPFRVHAVPVRAEADSVLCTVELSDAGRDGRQCAVGTARAVAFDA